MSLENESTNDTQAATLFQFCSAISITNDMPPTEAMH